MKKLIMAILAAFTLILGAACGPDAPDTVTDPHGSSPCREEWFQEVFLDQIDGASATDATVTIHRDGQRDTSPDEILSYGLITFSYLEEGDNCTLQVDMREPRAGGEDRLIEIPIRKDTAYREYEIDNHVVVIQVFEVRVRSMDFSVRYAGPYTRGTPTLIERPR